MLPSRVGFLVRFLISPVACRRLPPCRLAGHSKWANIKHTKAAIDIERGRYINQMHVRIRGATSDGNTDPEYNPRLRQIIEEAQHNNIPKTTVLNLLKKITSDKDGAKPSMLELRGPGPCYVLVDLLTRNISIFIGIIKPTMRRSRFLRADAKHAFEQRAYVVTDLPPDSESQQSTAALTDDSLLETATEHAIMSGAEEVRLEEASDGARVLVFSSDWENVYGVRKSLVECGYSVRSTDIVYEPLRLVQLQPDDELLYRQLVDKLHELPEVTAVTSNVQLSEQA